LRPKAAGLRTISRFDVGRRLVPYMTQTDRSDIRPCGFRCCETNAVFLDLAGKSGWSGPICFLAHRKRSGQEIGTLSFRSPLAGRAGGDRCIRSSRVATDPSMSSATAFNPRPDRVMPTRPSCAPLCYPNVQTFAAQPGGRNRSLRAFPVRRRSWGSTLRRFHPAGGWSRFASEAAK